MTAPRRKTPSAHSSAPQHPDGLRRPGRAPRVAGTNAPPAQRTRQISRTPAVSWRPALVADLVLVFVFAAIGIRNHGGFDVRAALTVAAPFAVGTMLGWSFIKAWINPAQLWPIGVVVWASTLVVGMLIRAATGAGTAASFIVVAGLILALFLLGWRALAAWLAARR